MADGGRKISNWQEWQNYLNSTASRTRAGMSALPRRMTNEVAGVWNTLDDATRAKIEKEAFEAGYYTSGMRMSEGEKKRAENRIRKQAEKAEKQRQKEEKKKQKEQEKAEKKREKEEKKKGKEKGKPAKESGEKEKTGTEKAPLKNELEGLKGIYHGNGTMEFRRDAVKDAEGNITQENYGRNISDGTKGLKQESMYFSVDDLTRRMQEIADANVAQGKKNTTLRLGGKAGKEGEEAPYFDVEIKNGKISDKSVAKMQKWLAENSSKIVLPSEKEIAGSNKKGWFSFDASTTNEAGEKEDASHKVQLSKDKRAGFVSEDSKKEFFELASMSDITELGDGGGGGKPVPPEPKPIEKTEKKKLPGWVKGVAIAGGIVAGVALVGAMAPMIMPGVAAMWMPGSAAAGGILHGVNSVVAGCAGLIGNPITYAAGSGVWTAVGSGAAVNVLAAGTTAATAQIASVAGIAGAVAGGIGVSKVLKGVGSLVSKGIDKIKGRGKDTSSAPAPSHDGPEKGE